MNFEWDENKNKANVEKHGISFFEAQKAFLDKNRIIAEDTAHSSNTEKRYYCFGNIDNNVLTIRFTMRDDNIRIIGAGYWRKGRRIYEQQNNI